MRIRATTGRTLAAAATVVAAMLVTLMAVAAPAPTDDTAGAPTRRGAHDAADACNPRVPETPQSDAPLDSDTARPALRRPVEAPERRRTRAAAEDGDEREPGRSRVRGRSPLRGSGDISFDVVERATKDVIAYLDERTDVHLVPRRRAQEIPVTLYVEDVTWREALEHLVRAGGFYMEQVSANVIVVDYVRASYDYDDADLREVIMDITRSAGANVILAPEVSGRLTTSFRDVPWNVALKRIVDEAGLVIAEQQRGILLIGEAERIGDTALPDRTRRLRDEWDTVIATTSRAGVISLDVVEEPLGELVQVIREHSHLSLVTAPEAREQQVTVKLRGLPWAEALAVLADRGGCRLRVAHPRLVIIERPPRVWLEVERLGLRHALNLVATQSNQSLIVDDGVEGHVTASLQDIPWRVAIDALVAAHGYHVIEGPHGVLRVTADADASDARERPRPPLPTTDVRPLDLRVVGRPLWQVAAHIAETVGVEIDLVDEAARNAALSLDVRELPWPLALELAVERAGCEFVSSETDRIVIDRPKTVQIDVKQAGDVRELIGHIASLTGENIHMDPGLTGRISMYAWGVSWRDALEAIADASGHHVHYASDGGIHVRAGRRGRRR